MRRELSMPAVLLCTAAGHDTEALPLDDGLAMFCTNGDCLSLAIVALAAASESVRQACAHLRAAQTSPVDSLAVLATALEADGVILDYELWALSHQQHGADADDVLGRAEVG